MKKKVLFLLEGFDKGGIEQVTLDIVNNLDPQKYDITVQSFWYGGHCQSLVNPNIKVKPFFFKRYVPGIIRLIQYLSPRLLYRFFVHGNYDIEIAASDGGAAKVISGSTNKKAKKICWVHMDVVNRGSHLKEFTDEETAYPIYSKFDVIVPVSDACKDNFIQKFGNSYKYNVKRNPIPVSKIIEKSDAFTPEYKSNEINIVCVGRLEEQKGFDRLFKAISSIISTTKKAFHVYIVGEGTKHEYLQNMISELEIESYVSLLGFQANPYPYIKNADVFLLSSRDEAYPLVLGESLILGTPVVATDCCGVSEWLNNGDYGLIVENSDEGVLFELDFILNQEGKIEQYKKKASDFINIISFEKSLNEFEELLNG